MITATKTTYDKYPAYKESGLEWLGEIPEHWGLNKLKFLGFLYSGLSGKKGDDFDKEKIDNMKPFIPFTNIFNNFYIDLEQFHYVRIDESENQNRVKKNDILFLMSSETLEDIGKNSIYLGENKEIYLNSFCKGFRITSIKLLPKFINYLLYSDTYRNYFSLEARGFTRINLKQEYVNNALVILPPLHEQEKIAEFLDEKTEKIDRAIAQKEKMIALLKERKQIIIQDLVTGKKVWNAEKNTWTSPEKTKDSGVEWIGEIPEHYTITKLGLCLKPVSEKNRPDLPLLSITRELGVIIRDTDDQDSNHNFIPDDLSGYKVIRAGQFGMNKMKAWQGSYGVSSYDGIVSPAYYVFDLISDITPDFFHLAIRSKIYVPFFAAASDGVRIGQWDLNKSRMKEIPLVIPPLDEQQKAIDFIQVQTEKIEKAISMQEQQIEKLKELKSTLIDSAVTGKIKVC